MLYHLRTDRPPTRGFGGRPVAILLLLRRLRLTGFPDSNLLHFSFSFPVPTKLLCSYAHCRTSKGFSPSANQFTLSSLLCQILGPTPAALSTTMSCYGRRWYNYQFFRQPLDCARDCDILDIVLPDRAGPHSIRVVFCRDPCTKIKQRAHLILCADLHQGENPHLSTVPPLAQRDQTRRYGRRTRANGARKSL